MNLICVWGPRPQAAWKRPILIALSALGIAGIAVLFGFFHDAQGAWVLYVFGLPLFGLGVLGVVVGVSGCRACVARVLGDCEII